MSDRFDQLMQKDGDSAPKKNPPNKGRRLKRVMLTFVITLCALAMIVSGIAVWGFSLTVNGKNLPNVYVDGIFVGGMTREETAAALGEAKWDALESRTLTVSLPLGTDFTLDYLRSGAALGKEQAVSLAARYGHDGNVFQNLWRSLMNRLRPVDVFTDAPALDEGYIRAAMDEGASRLNAKLNQAASSVDMEGAKLVLFKGAGGVELDRDALYAAIEAALRKSESALRFDTFSRGPLMPDFARLYQQLAVEPENAYYTETFEVVPEVVGCSFSVEEAVRLWQSAGLGEEVVVPLTMAKPEITAEQLSSLLYCNVLGAQMTYYYGSTPQRVNNIRLAAGKLDGLILLPGETFSYNEAVGKRTEEAGFQYADAYSDGQVVPELGGGICQVSSTLYGAVLYSHLKVVSRTNHYFKVGYLDYGLDATVSWGQPDFKFRNDGEFPIKLAAYLNEDEQSLVIEIWGTDTEGIRVQLWTTVEPVYDEDLTDVQIGNSVRTYGDVYDADGNFLRTENVNFGVYYFHDEDIDWPEGYERYREDMFLIN